MVYNNGMDTKKASPKKISPTVQKKAVRSVAAKKVAAKSSSTRVILDPFSKPKHRSIEAIRSAVRRAT